MKVQNGPIGVIVGNPDPLLAIGIIISKVWYGRSIPAIQIANAQLGKVLKDGNVTKIPDVGTV